MKPRLRWSLQIETTDLPEAHVLSLTGRLGSTTAAALEGALAGARAAGHRRVVLNLAGVDYLSSAGLAVMEQAAERARAAGGKLVICGLLEPVRVAFEVSGAAAELAVAEDLAQACEQLRQ